MCSPMIFNYRAQIAIVCSPIVAEIYCVTGAGCSGPNLRGFQPSDCEEARKITNPQGRSAAIVVSDGDSHLQ